MRLTHRRRLLAGLVFAGLAPIEALAQSHSNARLYGVGSSASRSGSSTSSTPSSSSSSTRPASSTPAAPAAPLPDCVLNKVDLVSGFKLSSKVETGNLIRGFELLLTLPASALRLTGLKKSDADDQVMLQITCQTQDGAPDGIAIASFLISVPEVTGTAAGAAIISFSAPTLKIGARSLKHDSVSGVAGSSLVFDAFHADASEYQAMATALRQGGALSLPLADDTGGPGRATITYTVPRLGPVLDAAKTKLDKLKSDATAGLCAIPSATAYPAKFCTTAAIDVLGLDRRCWELKALHDFRDWMGRNPGHAQEAETYNQRAPEVVRAIARRADAHRVWLGAYFTGVLPAAALARLGFNRLARLVYRALCLRLVRLAG